MNTLVTSYVQAGARTHSETHTRTHTHTHTHTHRHTHTHTNTHTNTHTYKYMHAHSHAHVFVCMNTHTHSHTGPCVCVCVYLLFTLCFLLQGGRQKRAKTMAEPRWFKHFLVLMLFWQRSFGADRCLATTSSTHSSVYCGFDENVGSSKISFAVELYYPFITSHSGNSITIFA